MAASSEPGVVGSTPYAVGDLIASKYRLDSLLGEGGMGAVWRAFNVQLEASVAIKLIRADLDRELFTQRLKQEARATAKLGHPAIVRIFDVGESESGDPFIVMELLDGRSLGAILATERRLGATQAVQLLLPVADALSVAHAKGIVHRDLKPDNVFIAIDDEGMQPKLVDFGIVKMSTQSDAPLTQAGVVLGSPTYMSPEQARGREDLDHRTDIWSFCVVLYEAVAGAVPFNGSSYNALLRSIVEDDPPPLASRLAGDPELWKIIRRGLAKDRDQRIQSMAELGRALAAWLIAQGVLEDACGGSLDAKWIARSNEALAGRASRASLASLNSIPPPAPSEPEGDPHLGVAPTMTATTMESPSVDPVRQKPIKSRFGVAHMLVLGAVVLVIGVAVDATRRNRALNDASQTAERPATASVHPASEPRPPVITLSPISPPLARRPIDGAQAQPLTESGGQGSIGDALPHAPQKSSRTQASASASPSPSPRAPKAPSNDAVHDLISPY